MTLDVPNTVELLALAMVVAIATRRLALPYTVGLVIVGAALAFARVQIGAPLTHDFIFYVILPPLLFEAALKLSWRSLVADAGILSAFAVLGTGIAAGVVTAGAVLILHWPIASAAIFGALIAATDPVAVIAMFKDNGVSGRLATLMESESLFNDAAAAILFSLALSFATGAEAPTVFGVAQNLLYVIVVGVVIGALCGGAMLLLAGQTSDHTIEIALTVLAAYGAFLLADKLGASGILATVTAGLVIGSIGILSDRDILTRHAKDFALEFWDFAAFAANSAVFPLIGISLGAVVVHPSTVTMLVVVLALVLVSRAFTVYPLCAVFAPTKQAVPLAYQHVLWWGGLRGALGLALALALPESLPYRQEVLLSTYAVVAFSIVAQGLTMPLLLRRLGLVARPAS